MANWSDTTSFTDMGAMGVLVLSPAGGQVGRWAGGEVGRWVGGQVGRWSVGRCGVSMAACTALVTAAVIVAFKASISMPGTGLCSGLRWDSRC